MSETRINRGLIVKLVNPLDKEKRKELMSNQLGIHITYNGKFAYMNLEECESWNFSLHIGRATPLQISDFIQKLQTLKLNPDVYSVQPFFCHWYNGMDCPLDMVEEL